MAIGAPAEHAVDIFNELVRMVPAPKIVREETFGHQCFGELELWLRSGRSSRQQVLADRSGRLDPDVVAHFRAGGPGWQSRTNAALRKAAGL